MIMISYCYSFNNYFHFCVIKLHDSEVVSALYSLTVQNRGLKPHSLHLIIIHRGLHVRQSATFFCYCETSAKGNYSFTSLESRKYCHMICTIYVIHACFNSNVTIMCNRLRKYSLHLVVVTLSRFCV